MAIETLEEKTQRLLDYYELRNLMFNLYSFTPGRSGNPWDEVVERFATNTPGTYVDITWGVFEGIEGLKKLYPGYHAKLLGQPSSPGQMAGFAEYDPIIEIAEDGKTAKSVIMNMGNETFPYKGKLQAYWSCLKRGFDFVKEDGKWKIWHYHVYGVYYAPYEEGWIKGFQFPGLPYLDEYPADRPTETSGLYRPDEAVRYDPAPPEPYETWDDSTSY